MTITSDNSKACNFLIAYEIKYDVFIPKESIVTIRIPDIFRPSTAQLAGQIFVIASSFHHAKTVSPYFPARTGSSQLFQEPLSLLFTQICHGMNILTRIRNILAVETNGIRWIVVIIMTT